MDEKILSYKDVLLRVGDVLLLRDGNWLNDQIIEFAFEYLLHEAYADLAARVAFVPGATSFLLSNMGAEDAAMMLGQLKCAEKDVLIFAVNDNADVEQAEGGSHWSMLVYWRDTGAFVHYDSSSGINRHPASRLARQVALALPRDGKPAPQSPRVQVGAMPRQTNGYDCGVYVIGAAELLCQALQQGGDCDAYHELLAKRLDSRAAGLLRSKYLRIIELKSEDS